MTRARTFDGLEAVWAERPLTTLDVPRPARAVLIAIDAAATRDARPVGRLATTKPG